MKLINVDTIPYFGETEVGDHITFKSAIDKLEEVDAVEVVRCKDCKHYKPNEYANGNMYCMVWADWLLTEDDDFCSGGERKDGGNE